MGETRKAPPFCKFLLAGSCRNGEHCKFRHHGPERPIATAYACEALGPFRPPNRTVTRKIDGIARVTFDAGMAVTEIQPLIANELPVLLTSVKSSLEVVWYQPTRNVWLSFESAPSAEAAKQILDGKVTEGVKLACAVKKSKARRKYCVQVSNATEAVSEEHIRSLLTPLSVQPAHIVVAQPSYDRSLSPVEIITKHIKESSEFVVKNSIIVPMNNKAKGKAVIEFAGAPNLASLARRLDGEQFHTRIYARERVEVILKIEQQRYRRRTRALKFFAKATWEEKHVSVRVRDSTEWDDTASDGKALAIAMIGPAPRTVVAEIKSAIETILLPPPPPPQKEKPPPLPRQTHRIRLVTTKAYLRVLRGGLEAAQNAVAEGLIYLDEDSQPPAVVVHGNASILRKVQAAIFPEDAKKRKPASGPECGICLDVIDDVVEMPECHHFCCTICFSEYCSPDRGLSLPLKCFEPGCTTELPSRFLFAKLGKEGFDAVARRATYAYLASHPDQYAQCTGADCGSYYGIDGDYSEVVCPNCFTVLCTGCRSEMHFSETCAEHKDRISGHTRAMEEYLASGRAKKCKQCGTLISKIDGCNHVICIGCNAEVCYACMAIFSNSDQVYQHMSAVHGGMGDERVELLEQVRRRLQEEIAALREREHDPLPFLRAIQEIRGRFFAIEAELLGDDDEDDD